MYLSRSNYCIDPRPGWKSESISTRLSSDFATVGNGRIIFLECKLLTASQCSHCFLSLSYFFSLVLALPPNPANKQDSQVACPWLVAVAFHNDPQKQKEFFHK